MKFIAYFMLGFLVFASVEKWTDGMEHHEEQGEDQGHVGDVHLVNGQQGIADMKLVEGNEEEQNEAQLMALQAGIQGVQMGIQNAQQQEGDDDDNDDEDTQSQITELGEDEIIQYGHLMTNQDLAINEASDKFEDLQLGDGGRESGEENEEYEEEEDHMEE